MNRLLKQWKEQPKRKEKVIRKREPAGRRDPGDRRDREGLPREKGRPLLRIRVGDPRLRKTPQGPNGRTRNRGGCRNHPTPRRSDAAQGTAGAMSRRDTFGGWAAPPSPSELRGRVCGSRPPRSREEESFPFRPLEGAPCNGQRAAFPLRPVEGVKESQPAGQVISQSGDTCAWLRELHGSQLTPGVCNINRRGFWSVGCWWWRESWKWKWKWKWKKLSGRSGGSGGSGGGRRNERGWRTRLLCAWVGRRKKEVGCVPEPLNVREPVLCIDPHLPDYPVP